MRMWGVVLASLLPTLPLAHEIPSDVTVRILVRPEGDRVHLLVRAPLEAMQDVTFPVPVMRALGAEELIVFNAVGGMNPHLDLGDVIAVTDHINLMGDNPLIGWNDDRLGDRFPDMSEPYTRRCRERVEAVALDLGIPMRRGVLVTSNTCATNSTTHPS